MNKTEKEPENKFQFDSAFQQSLLQYTVTDKDGHRALNLYEDHYFSLLEHQIVAHALKDYFKKNKRLPQSRILLNEHLRKIYLTKDFINVLSVEDKSRIKKVIIKMYSRPVKDGDALMEEIIKFAQYIKLKNVVETINLNDYNQYDNFSNRVRKAITVGHEFKASQGTFLITNIHDRQHRRKFQDDIIPTPFRGINKLTNGGGYPIGSVIVIIGPQKEFKTGMLINIGRSLLPLRRKVLYIDLENGQDQIALRFEQSLMNKSKKEILSGVYDEKVSKHFRKFKRLGSEVDIKRMSAYTTTCDHIQTYIDEQYREYGIRYTDLIVDYAALLGAISGNRDDFSRISDAHIDLKNLAERNKYFSTWTANHVVRESIKRYATKFKSDDIAKCIDVSRHVDAVYGFNRSEFDKNLGTARLEVIDQRDGVSDGTCLFNVDYNTQRATELSRERADEYWSQVKIEGGDTGGKDKKIYKGDL